MKTLNNYTKGNLTVKHIKNDKHTLGGLYSVELSHNNKVVNSRDGLCLNASVEVYNETVKQLHKTN